MRHLFIVLILSAAGCAGNDKKAGADNTVTTINIDGESLFKRNCASCHKPDKDFTAPALKGSLQRWGGDKKVMYDFIRNPSQSEIPYAEALKKKWAPAIMTSFNLSDAELDSIMNFCEYFRPINGEAVPGK